MPAKHSVLIALALLVAGQVHAQTARRGGATAAGVLADWANAEMQQERQLELIRAQRGEPIRTSGGEVSDDDPEFIELRTKHPQWARIMLSTRFNEWLDTTPHAKTCRSTESGRVVIKCIDAFFGPQITVK